jgi:hypothetical protein
MKRRGFRKSEIIAAVWGVAISAMLRAGEMNLKELERDRVVKSAENTAITPPSIAGSVCGEQMKMNLNPRL